MSFSDTVKRSWNENRLMNALLELTYACNLDCVFCYNDRALPGTPLSLGQYRRLLDDLADMGVLYVSLSGGEPLAHPEFFDIGRHARSRGFVTRIKTNGHAVKENVAQRIRDEIDPFAVEVSLHGATAATHDRQTRVDGSFERLVEHVRGMTKVGLRVQINSVLTRWNEHEVEGMLALADELGVRIQVDSDVKPRDDGDLGPLALRASHGGLRRYEETLRTHAGVALERPPGVERREAMRGTQKHCGAGSNAIAVDPYGNVLPCVQWRVPVGNLHDAGIGDIWRESVGLRRVRKTTEEVHRRLEAHGDAGQAARFCPGAAHTHHGDPLAMYPAAAERMDAAGRTRVRLAVVSTS